MDSNNSDKILDVLKITLNRLKILSNLRTEPHPSATLDIEPFHVRFDAERFRHRIYDKTGRLTETVQQDDDGKLLKDLIFLETLLEHGITSYVQTGNCDALLDKIEEMVQRETDENELIARVAKNREEIARLEETIRDAEEFYTGERERLESELAALKDSYEDTKIISNLKQRYIVNWEAARQEQNDLRIKLREKSLRDTIEMTRDRLDNESMVHDRLTAYLTIALADLDADLAQWARKQDEDADARDLDIRGMRVEIDELQAEVGRVSDILNGRQKEMDEYLALKEQRRVEEEIRQARNVAAIKIQAWWRGTMVRRGLGPYKKKKGSGKAGGKGSAKKSKK